MIIKKLDPSDNRSLKGICILIFASILDMINMYSLFYLVLGNPMVLGIIALIWIFSMFSVWIVLKIPVRKPFLYVCTDPVQNSRSDFEVLAVLQNSRSDFEVLASPGIQLRK